MSDVVAPPDEGVVSTRLVVIAALCVVIGIIAGVVAKLLLALIALITGLIFHGALTTEMLTPTTERLGALVVLVPVLGALVIGLMARYGAPAIRGHGIPEVMERVLFADSRISPRMMFLKPLSAAIAIGTGGPFGAEGPIIATGGAFGSFVGQWLHVTAEERKTLLAAGAAGGMAATFGTPVAAVLLAIELLLFEYRARSIIPVALAASAATAVRSIIIEHGPVFDMTPVADPTWQALTAYVVIGALIGFLAVGVTRTIYAIEDAFEKLPIHWMWWPALGALVVGVVGWLDPRVLGVGYEHIEGILTGELIGTTVIVLVALKFIAWSIYLGSGTSGGTLAPLFIVGGGTGAWLGGLAAGLMPAVGVQTTVAGLVGMAAIFAGASHALLASIVFAFEATRQPLGMLPLLAGCSAAYLVSILFMRTSIMTERLARRGVRIRPEYAMDFLQQVTVEEGMARPVISLDAGRTVASVRDWIRQGSGGATHQAFPVIDEEQRVLGVITRRDLFARELDDAAAVRDALRRAPVVVYPANTLRDAADQMVRTGVGRLPVIDPETRRLVGIVTRSDLLLAHERRLRMATLREGGIRTRRPAADDTTL
ncbi:MAG TPA: chloride channel protein [Longimicrobiales bacterium]